MSGNIIQAVDKFKRKEGEDWLLCSTCIDNTVWGVIVQHNKTGDFISTLVCLECMEGSCGVRNGYVI